MMKSITQLIVGDSTEEIVISFVPTHFQGKLHGVGDPFDVTM